MNVLILGADGYIGQPLTLYLRKHGHTVLTLDNYVKAMHMEGSPPLFGSSEPVDYEYSADIRLPSLGDIDAVVHLAEQPSAPLSMKSHTMAEETIMQNVTSTHLLAWKVREQNPDCHIVKLGTMGEYGTPGVHIPEGWFNHYDAIHNRESVLPFPKLPGSIYHCSKVMDSVLLEFACRAWDLRVTDLNQGVVYGCTTDELDETWFYYDAVFGTCLNRFIAQAVAGHPLTVYGNGSQTRGWINIRDSLECIRLAIENPAASGEFRVFNQFTEIFSVINMAELVSHVTSIDIQHIANPRVELEDHYYSASNEGFTRLGLQPHKLHIGEIAHMFDIADQYADRIQENLILPEVTWK